MPQYLDYPVKSRSDWNLYKKRLDPHSPGRWPDGWDRMPDGRSWDECDKPINLSRLSLFGSLRYYMGLENLSVAMYDDPTLVEDIVEWQAFLSMEMLKRVLDAGIKIDRGWIFEDMCHKTAPLVSPRFVKDIMAPRYKRVVDLLRSSGTDIILLDSDGNIDQLIPIWLDCGINGFYPFEVAGGMDGIKIRKRYDKEAIDGELEKCRYLLQFAGFFPSCDHHIPPDVPLENMVAISMNRHFGIVHMRKTPMFGHFQLFHLLKMWVFRCALVYFVNELRKMSDYEETRRFIDLPDRLDR